tara:strand:+ start:38701 stop:38907 length:207 start_codon:yes stop_codon:yes gene_type:complete
MVKSVGLKMVGVAQLVRAPGCGPGGRGFKSRPSPKDRRSSIEIDEAMTGFSNTFVTGELEDVFLYVNR